jgi:hypothetical protein
VIGERLAQAALELLAPDAAASELGAYPARPEAPAGEARPRVGRREAGVVERAPLAKPLQRLPDRFRRVAAIPQQPRELGRRVITLREPLQREGEGARRGRWGVVSGLGSAPGAAAGPASRGDGAA